MPLNPRSAVALGEVSSQVIHPEADLVLLVGFGFPEQIKDRIHNGEYKNDMNPDALIAAVTE